MYLYPIFAVSNVFKPYFSDIGLFLCSDCETYISADDLRINLWNLEISDQSFNIVDIKPVNMEDLTGMLRLNYM